jgi:hypothetical protein
MKAPQKMNKSLNGRGLNLRRTFVDNSQKQSVNELFNPISQEDLNNVKLDFFSYPSHYLIQSLRK